MPSKRRTYGIGKLTDDTAILINDNQFQFSHVFDILRIFRKQTGCKVNIISHQVERLFSTDGHAWLITIVKY